MNASSKSLREAARRDDSAAEAAVSHAGARLGVITRRRSIRAHLRLWGLGLDVVAAFVSYELALFVFSWTHDAGPAFSLLLLRWETLAVLLIIVAVFVSQGLYKLEVWVSRPLHALVLLRATVIALVLTAFVAFVFKTTLVSDSRLTVFVAFALFFVASAVLRLGLLDARYRRDVRERRGPTVVIGWSTDEGILVSRLKELRGYAQVRTLEPQDRRRNGYDAEPAIVEALRTAQPAPRQVFLDGGSLGHKATLDLIQVACEGGADVYVTGRLLSRLDSTGVLARLFEIPVMRVHRAPSQLPSRSTRLTLRAFDILASGVALVVLSPLFAVIAVAIKLDSRGPVFFPQERAGLHGRTFPFLKFRSMTMGNDAGEHREITERFVRGEHTDDGSTADDYGRPMFKLTGDVRVTRVGRRLRRYSLDELPQFWNVLKGDMSIIGPRPALSYEVEAYKHWHRLRLAVTPGVSGLWQVAGRSRVAFDDMVFQDVMYGLNQSVLTDLYLCAHTVPAVLMGSGGA